MLTHLSYSRDAEQEADRLAIDRLRAADISNQGLVDFFHRLAQQQGDSSGPLTLLSTHPGHETREALFEAAGSSGGAAISDADWQTLRTICDA